jgi:hypothetical protein
VNLQCFFGFHSCLTQDDDTHVWGECIRCRKRFGEISRKEIRDYIENDPRVKALDAKWAKERMEMAGFKISYEHPTAQARRRPRQHVESHLECIRQLPCVICRTTVGIIEAAHIRKGNRRLGKRKVGVGEKPDDWWTTPLCQKHHTKQHSMSEMGFWDQYEIDPFVTALALWAATGDLDVMWQIAMEARP